MKSRSIVLALPLTAFLLLSFIWPSSAQAPYGTCFGCHADETVLKAQILEKYESEEYG